MADAGQESAAKGISDKCCSLLPRHAALLKIRPAARRKDGGDSNN